MIYLVGGKFFEKGSSKRQKDLNLHDTLWENSAHVQYFVDAIEVAMRVSIGVEIR